MKEYTNKYTDFVNLISVKAKHVLVLSLDAALIIQEVQKKFPDAVFHLLDLPPFAETITAQQLVSDSQGNSLPIGRYDCIIVSGLIERLYSPSSILKSLAAFLNREGKLYCSVKNIQYHGIMEQIACGDFQYTRSVLVDHQQIRFYTYASFIKLMLDSGWISGKHCFSINKIDSDFVKAIRDYYKLRKFNEPLMTEYLSIYEFFFECTLNEDYFAELPPPFKISFVVAVNNKRIFNDYLLSSPVLQKGHPHQLIPILEPRTAADAIATGLHYAVNDFIVYLHQDVYLPEGWDRMFCHKVRQADQQIADIGIYGVYGVNSASERPYSSGYVLDRVLFHNSRIFPYEVHSLDECLFAFRKSGYPGTDPKLGFHLYATDLCCAYRDKGQKAVVIAAICYHNSMGVQSHTLQNSIRYFTSTRWEKYFPIHTPVTVLMKREERESFAQVVARFAQNNQLEEMSRYLQQDGVRASGEEVLAVVKDLLAENKVDFAFVLALGVKQALHEQSHIALALALGGIKLSFRNEAEYGRKKLQQAIGQLTVEERESFYQQQMTPLLLPLLQEAVLKGDKALAAQLLELMPSQNQ
ncbi:glycosyltransferase [Candidatus Magnetaquicoccus inordinatus]|uniref:glycosyltransferase n=1 Tax=Candidatus Magnetaquicoccus inordinatus TaxID=2496818 RepID=UPI00102B4B49|nr:glycosyltransferase [Candidatus Magnetaquicoccus inordinatus]